MFWFNVPFDQIVKQEASSRKYWDKCVVAKPQAAPILSARGGASKEVWDSWDLEKGAKKGKFGKEAGGKDGMKGRFISGLI